MSTGKIGATRYKHILGNKLVSTLRPKCDTQTDSPSHLLKCYNLAIPNLDGKEETWLAEVKNYLETIHKTETGKEATTTNQRIGK